MENKFKKLKKWITKKKSCLPLRASLHTGLRRKISTFEKMKPVNFGHFVKKHFNLKM